MEPARTKATKENSSCFKKCSSIVKRNPRALVPTHIALGVYEAADICKHFAIVFNRKGEKDELLYRCLLRQIGRRNTDGAFLRMMRSVTSTMPTEHPHTQSPNRPDLCRRHRRCSLWGHPWSGWWVPAMFRQRVNSVSGDLLH